MNRSIKRDGPQAAIVAALRAAGCSVEFITSATGRAGVPDLLVGRKGVTYLLEVKALVGKRKPHPADSSEAQILWHQRWRGHPVAVVTSTEEAYRAVGFAYNALGDRLP